MLKNLILKLIRLTLEGLGVGRFTYTHFSNGVISSSVLFVKPDYSERKTDTYTLSEKGVSFEEYGDHVMVDGRCWTV